MTRLTRAMPRPRANEEPAGYEVAHILASGSAMSTERMRKLTKAERKALKRKRRPGFSAWD